jgi:primosomal protein N' (replication factor Y)
VSQQQILKIALPSPLRTLFDYVLPASLQQANIKPGSRVELNFGKRAMVGLVIAIESSSTVDPKKLKPILSLLDDEPCLPEELLELGLWAAAYYQHPVGDVIFHILPNRLREPNTLIHKDLLLWKPTEKGRLIEPDQLGAARAQDRKSTRLNSSHVSFEPKSRMPSSA